VTEPFINPKNEKTLTANFFNLKDVVAAKNAYFKKERSNVLNYLDEKKLKKSPEAVDFLTLVSYNYGPNGVKEFIDHLVDSGYYENNKFLNNSPPDYTQV
jgi:hypothetical protein